MAPYSIEGPRQTSQGDFAFEGINITQEEIAAIDQDGNKINPLWAIPLLTLPLVAAAPSGQGPDLGFIQNVADFVGPVAGAVGHFFVETSPGHVAGVGILTFLRSLSLREGVSNAVHHAAAVTVLLGGLHFLYDTQAPKDGLASLASERNPSNWAALGFMAGVVLRVARTGGFRGPDRIFGSALLMGGAGAGIAEAAFSQDPIVLVGLSLLAAGASVKMSE